MKHITLISLFIFFSCGLKSSTNKKSTESEILNTKRSIVVEKPVINNDSCNCYLDSISNMEVCKKVDTRPAFEGGNNKLFEYLSKNITYNPTGDDIQLSYYVRFVVTSSGEIVGARIKNKSLKEYSEMETKIIGVINKMPKWKPAICDGRRVNFLYTLPIKF